jgi:hypothetical protein
VKTFSLVIAGLSFLAAAAITLAVIRGLDVGDDPLTFDVGAIVGAQAGAIIHAREKDAVASTRVKLTLGGVLAVVALVFGLVVHFAVRGLKYPEITIPIASVGSFVFPFALFNTMFNAMRQSKKTEG